MNYRKLKTEFRFQIYAFIVVDWRRSLSTKPL
jgi:hypothetical protein